MTTPVRWSCEPDMAAFMISFVPGHTENEIRAEFEQRFGIVLTEGQIANFKARHGIRSGTNGGRFTKGQKPWNKGRPQREWMGEEAIERTKETRFKKGQLPHNAREIGEERVTKDGYVQVHVRQRKKEKLNDQWVLKQRLVWEQVHGMPVPEGCKIIFCDGDKTNFDPENLLCVERKTLVRMNQMRGAGKVDWCDRATAEATAQIGRLSNAIGDALRRVKEADKKNGHKHRERGDQARQDLVHGARSRGEESGAPSEDQGKTEAVDDREAL